MGCRDWSLVDTYRWGGHRLSVRLPGFQSALGSARCGYWFHAWPDSAGLTTDHDP